MGPSAGLLAQFTEYLAEGQPVARGEPVRGRSIRPANATHHTREPR